MRRYTVLSVVTAALAVGANLVVFTIVNALWIRAQPIADPERVVVVVRDSEAQDGSRFSDAGLDKLRENVAFERVAGQVVTSGRAFAGVLPHVTIAEIGHQVETLGVTPEYFSVLGLGVTGRTFLAEDGDDRGTIAAIVSDRLWKTALGGRTDILGSTLEASPRPVHVVGIAPPGFEGARLGEHVDLWLPHRLLPQLADIRATDLRFVIMPMVALCRLRPGVTIESARAGLAQNTRNPQQVIPITRMFGAPDLPMVMVSEESIMTLVSATAMLVLLGGCATLMALVLVQYERRRTEFAIRLALGATRARLAQRLAFELSVVLATGYAGAWLLATWTLKGLPHFTFPGGIDLSRLDLSIDWRVATAGIVTCLLSIAAAATLPIVRFTRPTLTTSLIATHATSSRSSLRLRGVILAIHVAATIVVLVAAGLFVRTVQYGLNVAPGFEVDRVLFESVQIRPLYQGLDDAELDARGAKDLHATLDLIEKIKGLPGVEVVALGDPPVGPDREQTLNRPRAIDTDGAAASELPMGWLSVSPNYLSALGVPIVLGRSGNDSDVVISTTMAANLWPGDSPLGRRLAVSPFKGTVVGVMDMSYGALRLNKPAIAVTFDLERLLPLVIRNSAELRLAIRTANPDTLREPVRRVTAEVFPNATLTRVVSGRDLIENDLGRERLGAWFFSGFGLVTLILGVGGVFGLVGYLVESRRREFGVMMALGASHVEITRQAIQGGLTPALIGAAAGLVVATLLARTIESFLLGVSGVDPVTDAVVFVLVVGAAAGAGLVAALRVRRIAPMDALRAD